MPLPDALNPRGPGHSIVVDGLRLGFPWRGPAKTLPRPVVHDDDLRSDGVEKARRSGAVERAVPPRLPDGDLAQSIEWAGQFDFRLPVEVRQIEEPERAEREECSDHELVLRDVGRVVFRRGTERIQ